MTSQEIEVPCGFCGQEAKQETGIGYIGKSPLDPNAKPACLSCLTKHAKMKEVRKIKFKAKMVNQACICKDCGALIAIGWEKRHAELVHNCEKIEFEQ